MTTERSPREAEEFLATHPDVTNFQVILTDADGVGRGKSVRRNELARIYTHGRYLPGSILGLDITGADVEETGLVWEDGDADRACWPIPGTLVRSPWQVPAAGQLLISMYELDGTPSPGDPRHALKRVVDRLPAVVLVYRYPARNDNDTPALELLSTILGGGESSRLNRQVVREERAALGAGAFSLPYRRAGVGLFFAIANQGIEPPRLETLLNAEVDRLRNDSVASAELEKARNQFRAGAIRSRQTTMGIAESLQNALFFHGDLEAANRELDRYMAVTVADLRRVAQRYLAPENRLTVVVNPPRGTHE